MKAIILARVSSAEQEEEGHSLPAQIARLKDYCRRKNLEVIRTVQIVESSTRGKRKEFHELITFAKRQPGVTAIVADAVDRVQRGFKESVMLDELIRQEKIELHFNREGMIIGKDARAADIMRWDFCVMAAKSYVLQLSDNVKRSIEYKLKNGEVICQAPPGYLHIEHPHTKRSTVVVDPDGAPIVEEIFRRYATGTTSLPELAEMANKMGYKTRKSGKPMTRSAVHLLIQNPFYYGQMRIKGKLYDHQYPRLVDKDLFDACQAVRLGWNKKPFQYRGKDSLFRGILRCGTTGKVVTMQTKKGRYNYLTVADPMHPDKKLWLREEDVIEQVAEVFKSWVISKQRMDEIRSWLAEIYEVETAFHTQQVDLLGKQLSAVNTKIRRLTELLVEGALTVDEHGQMRNTLMEKRAELEMLLEQHKQGDDGFVDTISLLLGLMDRAYDLFLSSQNGLKRQFLNLVFENLSLKGAKLEYALRPTFTKLVETTCVVNGDPYRTELELRQKLECIRNTPTVRSLFTLQPVSQIAREIQRCAA